MCLFKTDAESSENFEYPSIERVKITSDGVPGAVYNHGIPKDKLFLEAKRLLGNKGVTESTFYLGSQFALVIDLRTTDDKNLFGNGKEMSKKKESQVHIEIKKKPTESNITCYVYLVRIRSIRRGKLRRNHKVVLIKYVCKNKRYRFRRLGSGNNSWRRKSCKQLFEKQNRKYNRSRRRFFSSG